VHNSYYYYNGYTHTHTHTQTLTQTQTHTQDIHIEVNMESGVGASGSAGASAGTLELIVGGNISLEKPVEKAHHHHHHHHHHRKRAASPGLGAAASATQAEENCNWLEANVLALQCDLPRDTIVATITSIDKELESFVSSVENTFSMASLLSEEQLTTNVTYAIQFLNVLKGKVVEHITKFLDDRRSQDQLSLLGFKKRMLDSVTVCRSSVEQLLCRFDFLNYSCHMIWLV
jgi:hypothetical protein